MRAKDGKTPVGCLFIKLDPHDPNWAYCQMPTQSGSSYCETHHAKCHRGFVHVADPWDLQKQKQAQRPGAVVLFKSGKHQP